MKTGGVMNMRRASLALVVLASLAGLGWAGGTIYEKVHNNRHVIESVAAEREGWARHREQMEHPPVTCSFTIPRECQVAKTDIVSEDSIEWSGSLWLTSNNGAGDYGAAVWLNCNNIEVRMTLESDDPNGRARFVGTISWGGGGPGEVDTWNGSWFTHWLQPGYVEQTIDWPFTISSTGSYIDRDRTMEPWRGSTIGPTHAIESRFSEVWVNGATREVTVTFGELSWADAETIYPDSSVGVGHYLHWPSETDFDYAKITLESTSFEYDFTSIEDHCYGAYDTAPLGTNPGEGNMGVWGDGSALNFRTFGAGTGFGAHPYIYKTFSQPRVLDLRQTGLCGWGDTSPDDDLYGSQLHWLWNGYAVCPVWRYQDGPLWVPGDATCGSPPGLYPQWAGPAWDAVAGKFDPMWNPLDAYCPYCGSQLRPGGMLKVPWVSGWPDTSETDWESTGEFQDSTEAPLTQSQLHNVFDPYAQRLTPYSAWDKKAEYADDDYDLLSGSGGTLLVDRTNGRKNRLPDTLAKPGGVPVIPIHVGGCNSTSCSSSPYFNLAIDFKAVDVDLSGTTGARVSAWESDDFSVSGGAVGTSSTVKFTVPAGGGTLKRGPLIDPYWGRNAAMIAAESGGAFSECYTYHKNNTAIPGGWPSGWTDTDCQGGGHAGVDVTWWATHRYATLVAAPDTGWDGITLPQLRLTYSTEAVDDNLYDSWPTKDVEVSVASSGLMLTIVGARNGDTVYYDLLHPRFARLEHVTQIEVIFAEGAAGDWTLNGLRLDPSDAAPGATTALSTTTMHQCHHAYDWGGIRGVIDGRCVLALRATDCGAALYQPRHVWKKGLEELIPDVDEVYTLDPVKGTLDTSTVYSLEKYARLIEAVGEGWTATTPGDWDSRYKDGDGTVLDIGRAFDVVENQDYGGVRCGFSGWLWQGVAGLCYTPHGVLCAQGGIHGLSNVVDTPSFVVVERRLPASGYDDWTAVAPALGSDAHGYWAGGFNFVEGYYANLPAYWQFRVDDYEFARLYARQWQWAYYNAMGWPDIDIGRIDGITHLAWISSDGIYYSQIDDQLEGWRYGAIDPVAGKVKKVLVMPTVDGPFDNPSVTRLPTDRLIVTAHNRGLASTRAMISKNQGETWEVVAKLGEGLTLVNAKADPSGIIHVAGYNDGKIWYQRSDDEGETLCEFGTGGTVKKVTTADAQQPATVPMPAGGVMVIATLEGKARPMVSKDGGETWAVADTIS